MNCIVVQMNHCQQDGTMKCVTSLTCLKTRIIHFTWYSPSTYNPGQNIWNKIDKSSKTGQDKKSLISTFACFLTATAKVSFLEGRLGTGLCLDLSLRFFYYFLISWDPRSFGNLGGNSYTKSALPNLRFSYHFLIS